MYSYIYIYGSYMYMYIIVIYNISEKLDKTTPLKFPINRKFADLSQDPFRSHWSSVDRLEFVTIP